VPPKLATSPETTSTLMAAATSAWCKATTDAL
jgi:hypothetical protein